MAFLLRLALLCFLTALTGACAQKTLVALVPDPEGQVGNVSVTSKAGSVEISDGYRATTVAGVEKPPTVPKDVDRKDLLERFTDALSVQPKQPLHFLLFFGKEADLSPDSLELLPVIVAGIRERNSAFISLTGHTDTLGAKEYNVDISLRRAMVVRNLLVRQGVDAATIWIDGVGEESLSVPTEDEVWQPKNRRVEVVVR